MSAPFRGRFIDKIPRQRRPGQRFITGIPERGVLPGDIFIGGACGRGKAAVNDELGDSPELVNSEPYAGGWIFKIKASDEAEVAALLDATAYEALLEDE